MNPEEQTKNSKKQPQKVNENEDETEDLEDFVIETWNNLGSGNSHEWITDWDNKPKNDDFFNELKAFLLKK